MPALFFPFLVGVAGFGAGFWSGSATDKLLKVGAMLAVLYLAYRFYKGGK